MHDYIVEYREVMMFWKRDPKLYGDGVARFETQYVTKTTSIKAESLLEAQIIGQNMYPDSFITVYRDDPKRFDLTNQ